MTTYMKHSAPDLLNKAAAIMEERGKQYDKPEGERSMAQTVAIFNLHHGLGMTEAQGWHFMQILKDVRLFQNPGYHQDSAEDCIAYAALKAEAKQLEQVSNTQHLEQLRNAVYASGNGQFPPKPPPPPPPREVKHNG